MLCCCCCGFTGIDFHEKFFTNYDDLMIKQYDMLIAINTVTTTVDGKTISTANGADIMGQIGSQSRH
jgi:hypothetical protein